MYFVWFFVAAFSGCARWSNTSAITCFAAGQKWSGRMLKCASWVCALLAMLLMILAALCEFQSLKGR